MRTATDVLIRRSIAKRQARQVQLVNLLTHNQNIKEGSECFFRFYKNQKNF